MFHHIRSMLTVIAFVFIPCGMASAFEKSCDSWEGGLALQAVEENGKVLQLDDGSRWRVEDRDLPTVIYWAPGIGTIDICDSHRLTNSHDGGVAHAKRIN